MKRTTHPVALSGKEIGDFLRNRSRSLPVIVVTLPAATRALSLTPDDIAAKFGERCDVIVVNGNRQIDVLNDSLKASLSTFGHAARVLPPGDCWNAHTEGRSRYTPLAYMDRGSAFMHIEDNLFSMESACFKSSGAQPIPNSLGSILPPEVVASISSAVAEGGPEDATQAVAPLDQEDEATIHPAEDMAQDASPRHARPAVPSSALEEIGLALMRAMSEYAEMEDEISDLSQRHLELEEKYDQLIRQRSAAPSASPDVDVEKLQSEIAEARRTIRDLADSNGRLRERSRKKDQTISDLNLRLLSASRPDEGHRPESRDDDLDGLPLFADPADQIRHEVYLSWATRLTADDKTEYPLGSFRVLPSFVESLEKIEGIKRSKVIDVMAEVACQMVFSIESRSIKQGIGPASRSAELGVCWRVRLQGKVPNSRRLLVWRDNKGSWAFDSVKGHDDFDPDN